MSRETHLAQRPSAAAAPEAAEGSGTVVSDGLPAPSPTVEGDCAT